MRVYSIVSFLVMLLVSGAAQASEAQMSSHAAQSSAVHVSSHTRTKSCVTESFSADDVRTQTAQVAHRRTRSNSQSPQRRYSPQFLQVPPPTFRCGTLPTMKLPSVTKFSPVKRSSSIRRPSSIVVTNEVEGKQVLEASLDNPQEEQNRVQMERKVAVNVQKHMGAALIAVSPQLLALFCPRVNVGAIFKKQVDAAMKGDAEAREEVRRLIQSGDLEKFLVDFYGKELGEKKVSHCVSYLVANVKGLVPDGYICPLCYVGVKNKVVIIVNPCLHIFCMDCIKTWKKESKKKSCPCCRRTMHSPERGSRS